MIRLFTALCKKMLENLSDESIFQETADVKDYYDGKCPFCGANGKLSPYGAYTRGLVSHGKGKTTQTRVDINRFICDSCGATHGLLPDILVPYSPYTLRFKLNVLIAYFERETTVVKICEHFGIAVSTLYEWKKCLLLHKQLLLGVIIDMKKPALAFLYELLNSHRLSDILLGFFRKYAWSFLQVRSKSATYSNTP